MRVAFVHYHLRRGGVTRVIASAIQALGENVEAVVLSSTQPDEPMGCPVQTIAELAYDESASPEKAAALYRSLKQEARAALGTDPDIWHIHNHCLGKNVNFPEAIRMLLADETRVLLQIHDFAEDGRPANYQSRNRPYREGVFEKLDLALFPTAAQIGYAVLNGRDQSVLTRAGIPKDRILLLPNAVTPPDGTLEPDPAPGNKDAAPLILYPTRGIRRKNLGELLLMATAYPEFRYATTLTPDNPRWQPVHDAWVSLAKELRLPVEFGLGERPGASFPGLIAEARSLVTTSVGEGFGLAFLEPWLMGKSVCGRDLPDITSDFKKNGIDLPELYAEWPVANRLFSLDGLHQRFIDGLGKAYRSYGRELDVAAAEDAFGKRTSGGAVDFGYLDESAQAEVLRQAADNPRVMEPPFLPSPGDPQILAGNQRRIRELYGLDRYGKNLESIYRELLSENPGEVRAADSDAILDAFLSPERFLQLRS